MGKEEAKRMIEEEFMKRFDQWKYDNEYLPYSDLGRKYGYTRPLRYNQMTDLEKMNIFRTYIFAGHYLKDWQRLGIDKYDIWELKNDGFLSYQYYSDWTSRQTGRSDFYYLSKREATKIFKKYRDERR